MGPAGNAASGRYEYFLGHSTWGLICSGLQSGITDVVVDHRYAISTGDRCARENVAFSRPAHRHPRPLLLLDTLLLSLLERLLADLTLLKGFGLL